MSLKRFLPGSQSQDELEREIKGKLDKCNTINEMFKVMNEYYNLDQNIPPMLKQIAANNIAGKMKTVVKFLSIKRR